MSGWWKYAYVGQNVVCVNPIWGTLDKPTPADMQMYYCPNLPEAGAVYTIRTVECYVTVRGQEPNVLIRLEEVINPQPRGVEPVFFAENFRPAQTKSTETGMAIIRNILHQTSVKERS